MNETLTLLLDWSAGGLLGAIFFGGLWWTIAKGTLSNHPALWFTGSLALRMSIVLAGFYFVCDHHCERLLLCLTGFIVAGLAVTLITGATKEKQTSPLEETSHAP